MTCLVRLFWKEEQREWVGVGAPKAEYFDEKNVEPSSFKNTRTLTKPSNSFTWDEEVNEPGWSAESPVSFLEGLTPCLFSVGPALSPFPGLHLQG